MNMIGNGPKDEVFNHKIQDFKKFAFNQEVAAVFDDMVARSIPYYGEIQRMILDLLKYQLGQKSRIVDVGCSTGTTLSMISKQAELLGREVELIGIDPSAPMLFQARQKLAQNEVKAELIEADALDYEFENVDMVILNYTLQFIPEGQRLKLLQKIEKAMKPGGIIFLSEKIKSPSRRTDDLLVDIYYDFKRRNGYSELEISQKRKALEDVLIPWTPGRHIETLTEAGFHRPEMFFRWTNFASFIGFKGH